MLLYGTIMSKTLPIIIAAVLGGVALVPIYLASQNPEKFQAAKHALTFNTKAASTG